MGSNSKTVRRCEIVSRLTSDDGKKLFDTDKAKAVIQAKQKVIQDYSYIIHDKDVYEDDNGQHGKGDLKPAHIHLLLRFKDNQPQKLRYIAQWFDIPENFIDIVHGDWKSACLYQIHFNAEDKYQYDPSEVTANFDYEALVEEARQEEGGIRLEKVLKQILSGEIREYNKTVEIDGLMLVRNARQIEQAFRIRSEYLQATCKERKTECIYITGASGSGKTALAKMIADERKLDYFVSSGSNDIMDGYAQEPCLILDDIRPSALGLSDLLKMLDPHTASSVRSRYKNKYLNCDLVILTTVLDIDSFYSNVFAEQDEPVTQLKRRCGTYIRMDRDNISVSLWDPVRMHYTPPVVYKNPVPGKFTAGKQKTTDDVILHVADLLPGLELEEDEDINPNLYRCDMIPVRKQVPHLKDCISDGEFRKIRNRQD